MLEVDAQIEPLSVESPKPWGQSVCIDCYDCDAASIRDADKIKLFSQQLVEHIQMKAFGPCHVVHFGQDARVAGFSMFQLIETSCISAHFSNQSQAAYIDIFSCKDFDANAAAKFCKQFFQARTVHVQKQLRR